jgi:hypothetical protein
MKEVLLMVDICLTVLSYLEKMGNVKKTLADDILLRFRGPTNTC